jgi:2-polyprenyl-6-hydroxyphenyl methylase/3-demethylubiquinone-9 3-methyltransferase
MLHTVASVSRSHEKPLQVSEPAFPFGENWRRFLSVLNDERISQARSSLESLLGVDSLAGKSFLDVGCGSGLFSLAALKLGARVRSFDYDPQSVACAVELRARFGGEANWTIERGSALDESYLSSLGQFEFVYSWGVLHHTGDMWRALSNMPRLVAPGGHLVLSIYNDQGVWSRVWREVKRTYNRVPPTLRVPYAIAAMVPHELRSIVVPLAKLRFADLWNRWAEYGQQSGRGMSKWHDLIDWVGGYPFEVAKPEDLFEFYRARGFELRHLRTCAGELGCNEFRFQKQTT